MQPHFLAVILELCKRRGVHTATDTCGYASWDVLSKIVPFTDLFLFDIKIVDDEQHKRYTGVSNKLIHENLKRLLEAGKLVWIRIPLIPGITATKDNIFGILSLLKTLPAISNVSLLNFHKGGQQKYRRSGLEYALNEAQPLSDEEIATIKTEFVNNGYSVMVGE